MEPIEEQAHKRDGFDELREKLKQSGFNDIFVVIQPLVTRGSEKDHKKFILKALILQLNKLTLCDESYLKIKKVLEQEILRDE